MLREFFIHTYVYVCNILYNHRSYNISLVCNILENIYNYYSYLYFCKIFNYLIDYVKYFIYIRKTSITFIQIFLYIGDWIISWYQNG